MTTTNGTRTDTDLALDEALSILDEQRRAVLKQRKGLEIRYRIQKKLGDGPDVLNGIVNGLQRMEAALEEIDVIEREWTQP